MLYNLHRSIT